MNRPPQLMQNNVRFYTDKAIDCYSGHALTEEKLLEMVMKLSKGSLNPHEVIRIINTEYG